MILSLLCLAAAVALWCTIPALWVLSLPGVPIAHRRAAALSFGRASVRGLAMLLPDLVAPLVVPIALLGCRWDSEHLPRWARWWDNDVGLNGDRFPAATPGRVPLDDTPEARALCYWAPGYHPRSYWARFVWLGLRNRASALAVMLGHPADPAKPVQTWGDEQVSRARAGWFLREHNGAYQLHATRQIGRLCLRTNYGHKVFFVEAGRPTLPVVCITISLLTWKGEPAAAREPPPHHANPAGRQRPPGFFMLAPATARIAGIRAAPPAPWGTRAKPRPSTAPIHRTKGPRPWPSQTFTTACASPS